MPKLSRSDFFLYHYETNMEKFTMSKGTICVDPVAYDQRQQIKLNNGKIIAASIVLMAAIGTILTPGGGTIAGAALGCCLGYLVATLDWLYQVNAAYEKYSKDYDIRTSRFFPASPCTVEAIELVPLTSDAEQNSSALPSPANEARCS